MSCAVHAKAKTALEVAEEIARAASARLPEDPDDLAPAIREALDERGGHRFNVIIDALDEAANPAQARAIIDRIMLPLAETCSDVGAQVVVGTRRRDDGGICWAGSAVPWPPSTSMTPLTSPGRIWPPTRWPACSWQVMSGRATPTPMTRSLARSPIRIAALADQNFLVAGLIARSHGLHDEKAADPNQLSLPATVDRPLLPTWSVSAQSRACPPATS